MQVFIFEHVCGGGGAGDHLSSSLLKQGGAMLRAVARDLLHAGHKVAIMLDERVDWSIQGAMVSLVSTPQELHENFDACARAADVTLVIAPESGDLLCGWLRRLDELGCYTLNSAVEAVDVAGDKLRTWRALRDAGVPTPPTARFDRDVWAPEDAAFAQAAQWIVKPRRGVGTEHTYVVAREASRDTWPSVTDAIIQPRALGGDVSVSLMVSDMRATPLLAGAQHIVEQDDEQDRRVLIYRGNSLPLADEDLAERATDLAIAAAKAVTGLRGFVGVDIVLGERPADDTVIEINPRLTMSYLALSKLADISIAEVMLTGKVGRLGWKNASVSVTAEGEARLREGEA